MKSYYLEIISPEGIVFKGQIDSLILPGVSGSFGILNDHCPFFAALDIGVVEVKYFENPVSDFFATSGGFFQMIENKALILSEYFEIGKHIDIESVKDNLEHIIELSGSASISNEQKHKLKRIMKISEAKIKAHEMYNL